MKEVQNPKEILEWHPAFYAGIQIELAAEANWLTFESEHQLGTKPKEIDVLIIKKEKNYHVQKNIGRIFRKHNIIEYKSPTDYLSIDDFYRVYGYACFYKADTGTENSISINELTLTFVCRHYPRKLMKHLQEIPAYRIQKTEPGIYYMESPMLPIQFIITSRLSEKENLWLKCLTDDLKKLTEAEHLISEYRKYKDNTLYRSVMDIIVRANRDKFQEVKEMCTALEELMKDEIDANRAKGLEEGRVRGLAEGQKLTLISQIQRKVQKNKTPEDIASELEESLDIVTGIYNIVKAYPTETGTEIYQRLCAAEQSPAR